MWRPGFFRDSPYLLHAAGGGFSLGRFCRDRLDFFFIQRSRPGGALRVSKDFEHAPVESAQYVAH
jgi:hypothetical protein